MQNDKQEFTATNSIAEAIRGLARDRSALLANLLSPSLEGIDLEYLKKETQAQIAAIDARIDKLLELEYERLRLSPVPVTVTKEIQ